MAHPIHNQLFGLNNLLKLRLLTNICSPAIVNTKNDQNQKCVYLDIVFKYLNCIQYKV